MKQKNLQRYLSLWMVVMMLVLQFAGVGTANVAQAEETQPELSTRVSDQLDKTISNYAAEADPKSHWDAFALYLSQKQISNTYIKFVETNDWEKVSSTTDLALAVLGIQSAGLNPTNINGTNLIEKIYSKDISQVTSQGVNALAWALLALDSGDFNVPDDATINRESLLRNIVSSSLNDGGWPSNLESNSLDPDTTGMVLSALAPYNTADYPKVQEKITDAVNRIKAFQPDNSNSLAQIIIGLSSIGIDSSSSIEDLLTYSREKGSFAYNKEDVKGNRFATRDALYALISYKKLVDTENGLIYQGIENKLDPGQPGETDNPADPPEENGKPVSVTVRVEGPESTIIESLAYGTTAFQALSGLLDERNIDYSVTVYDIGPFINYIGKDYPDLGGWWAFAVKREGRWIFPEVGSDSFPLQEKDQVLFYYNDDTALINSIRVNPNDPNENEAFSITVNQAVYDSDALSPAQHVQVRIGEQLATTDEHGVAMFPQGLSKGSYKVEVTGYQEGKAPKVVRETTEFLIGSVQVNVFVEGPLSSITKGSIKGITAQDALQRTLNQEGIDYSIEQAGWGSYIDYIGSKNYYDYGGFWLYMVKRNGEWVTPDRGIDSFLLVDSDQVYFYYANNTDLIDSVSFHPEHPQAYESFSILIKKMNGENTVSPAAGVQVTIGAKTVTTNKDGLATFPYGLTSGNHKVVISGNQPGKAPSILRQQFEIQIQPSPTGTERRTVSIMVRGDNDKGTILPQQSIDWEVGDTPYSILIRAIGSGRVQTSGSGDTLYVKAIDGLAQFDKGPKSGWQFSINGWFPERSAASYELAPGDEVRWLYTLDLGADLGNPGTPASKVPISNEDFKKALESIGFTYDNLKPLKDIVKTVAILNISERMSVNESTKLAEQLKKNVVGISEPVPSAAEMTLQDREQEVQLFIPAGALDGPKTITVKELSASQPELLSSLYEFGPNGTQFDQPVQISIKVPLGNVTDLEQLAMVWWNETTSEWIPIPAVVDTKTGIVSGQVDHFTKFAVIDRTKLHSGKGVPVASAIESSAHYILGSGDISDWEAFALARAGKAVPASYLSSVEALLKEKDGVFRNVTDYERMVLGVVAAGGDPRNIAGYDLIEKIYNNERMTLQGTNGVMFALIALNSGNYDIPSDAKWSKEKLLNWLLEEQNEDGSFALVVGDPGIVDLTGMALGALEPYRAQDRVQKAINKAVAWLSAHQTDQGGYQETLDGTTNSEAVSQVILGLSAIGIDPTGSAFSKSEGNLVTNLLSYQLSNGGFAHNPKDQKPNEMATEQALSALVAYDSLVQGKGSIYRFDLSLTEVYRDMDRVSAWAKPFVLQAHQHGLMEGTSKTVPQFEPKKPVTRAEFAKILVQLLGDEPASGNEKIFDDVPVDSWYYGYVAKAKEKGIVQGITATTFMPNKSISRQEMAIMIAKAMKWQANGGNVKFNDLNAAYKDAVPAILAVVDHGVMTGYREGVFAPRDPVTREMAATVAVKVFEK